MEWKPAAEKTGRVVGKYLVKASKVGAVYGARYTKLVAGEVSGYVRSWGETVKKDIKEKRRRKRIRKEAKVKQRADRLMEKNSSLTEEEAKELAKSELKEEKWDKLLPDMGGVAPGGDGGSLDGPNLMDNEEDVASGLVPFEEDKKTEENTFLGVPVAEKEVPPMDAAKEDDDW